VPDEALARRKQHWRAPAVPAERGYLSLYERHVNQAPDGCDFDFLARRAPIPEPEIH
jgi:dihydroxy-acid dehydratase